MTGFLFGRPHPGWLHAVWVAMRLASCCDRCGDVGLALEVGDLGVSVQLEAATPILCKQRDAQAGFMLDDCA